MALLTKSSSTNHMGHSSLDTEKPYNLTHDNNHWNRGPPGCTIMVWTWSLDTPKHLRRTTGSIHQPEYMWDKDATCLKLARSFHPQHIHSKSDFCDL